METDEYTNGENNTDQNSDINMKNVDNIAPSGVSVASALTQNNMSTNVTNVTNLNNTTNVTNVTNLDNINNVTTATNVTNVTNVNNITTYDNQTYGGISAFYLKDPDVHKNEYSELLQSKYSREDKLLKNFIEEFKLQPGDQKANIICHMPGSTFYIPNTHIAGFFKHINSCRLSKAIVHYGEKQYWGNIQHSGIMLDFDYYQTTSVCEITPVVIYKLVTRIANLLNQFLVFDPTSDTANTNNVNTNNVNNINTNNVNNINTNNVNNVNANNFKIIVIKKPELKREEIIGENTEQNNSKIIYKDGIHILIPELWVSKGFKYFLMQEIVKRDILKHVFTGNDMHCVDYDEMRKNANDAGKITGNVGGVNIGSVGNINNINTDNANLIKNQPYNKCLDQNSKHVPVMFLGNCKVKSKAYPIDSIYDVIIDQQDQYASPMVQKIEKPSESLYNLTYEFSLTFRVEPCADIPKTWLYKRIMSYKPEVNTSIDLYNMRSVNGEISESRASEFDNLNSEIKAICNANADMNHVFSLVSLLSAEYSNEYEKWRNVVWALSSLGERFRIIAHWFSMRSATKYNKRAVDDVWDVNLGPKYVQNIQPGSIIMSGITKQDGGGINQQNINEQIQRDVIAKRRLTFNSIIYWAKECNPVGYKSIQSQSAQQFLLNQCIRNDGVIEHFPVATIIKMLIGGRWVSEYIETKSSTTSVVWYHFVDPETDMNNYNPGEQYKWRRVVKPSDLINYIATVIPGFFDKIIEVLNDLKGKAPAKKMGRKPKQFDDEDANEAENANNGNNANNANEKNQDEERHLHFAMMIKKFRESRTKLGNTGFQNGIVTSASHLMVMRGFTESLDKEEDILGVGNGVLKLIPQPHLIKRFNEYRVHEYTPVEYHPYDPNNPMIQKVEKAWRSVFIEPDVYNAMIMALSTFIDKRPARNMLITIQGSGANGKSATLEQAYGTLGDKMVKRPPMSLWTMQSASDPDKPSPAVFSLKGGRGGYSDEGGKLQTLNSQALKTYLNTSYPGRGLNRDQEMIQSTAIYFALTNFEFAVDEVDYGTWRRLYNYNVKTKFKSANEIDHKNPHEKLLDPDMKDKYPNDPQWKIAVLSIMVHYNEILYNRYGYDLHAVMKESPTIVAETQAFRDRNDKISRFINQMIVRSPNSVVPLTVITSKYNDWYQENIGRAVINNSEFMKNIENSDKVGNFVYTDNNDVKQLRGHRLLMSPNEELTPDESYIVPRKIKNFPERAKMINVITKQQDTVY